ncbi:protein transporter Sec31 [Streptomyces sp. MMS20-AI2-20]|uniref:protein transporter Sec31 n=1 Tax=Streptomyces sp. MMS20-AI2-20 TaxID=2925835 RepID=UPI001F607724|nr:protein transporter Sec31 [Streptomyces sp. MMS20-AI2-20]MCI4143038.1 protein transporter Sec31 [Streptomyces sp. MMS20-AI2-20]
MKTRRTTQLVPHTVDGKTRLVAVAVDTPAPPRDWDAVVLKGVTVIAAVVLTASVVWSTASIGDLLARAVIEPAAYGAAVVFDLTWIACMAVEWLARYDEDRARLPRLAGHVMLILAMLAVAAHGKVAGHWEIGLIGATVSALAKGLWTVVLRHQTPPLNERTRAWIQGELADAGASLALIPVRRQLQRAQAQLDAERTAIGSADPDQSGPTSGQSADSPEALEQPAASGPMTIKDAVRTALDSGIRDHEQVLAYVRKVADANAKPDTVSRYIRLAG